MANNSGWLNDSVKAGVDGIEGKLQVHDSPAFNALHSEAKNMFSNLAQIAKDMSFCSKANLPNFEIHEMKDSLGNPLHGALAGTAGGLKEFFSNPLGKPVHGELPKVPNDLNK